MINIDGSLTQRRTQPFLSFRSHFNLKVEYRQNCDFQVDDMERDLSARFIDMDEHYFTPTMAKYQQEQDMQRTRSASSYEGGSAKAKTTVTGFKPVSSVNLLRSKIYFFLIMGLV